MRLLDRINPWRRIRNLIALNKRFNADLQDQADRIEQLEEALRDLLAAAGNVAPILWRTTGQYRECPAYLIKELDTAKAKANAAFYATKNTKKD